MIWGIFSYLGSDIPVFLEVEQIAMRYTGRSSAHCNDTFLHSDGNRYFMDSNATTHRARSVQNWFTEPQSDFQHFSCPSHIRYLNLTENVRYMVERHIRQHSPLPSNL
ncbi:hypothetical protein TNCV_2771951 [Trichonephila clavipes]|nr:hypothetical protein TNCV_2771951 [Trichonephila clavipes]